VNVVVTSVAWRGKLVGEGGIVGDKEEEEEEVELPSKKKIGGCW
jgi:hypothetical protein